MLETLKTNKKSTLFILTYRKTLIFERKKLKKDSKIYIYELCNIHRSLKLVLGSRKKVVDGGMGGGEQKEVG